MSISVYGTTSNAKAFRDSAAHELRESRSGRSKETKANNVKRAAAYKALAETEEWLSGEKQRSRKSQIRNMQFAA